MPGQAVSSNRIDNLDYFRGIAATSIMVFHFCFWSYGILNSEDILGRVGIYGVSVFYILSGLTMCIVYEDKITTSLSTISDFLLKRVVRIFPLLWLATTLTLLINLNHLPDATTIILNYTGLFGFVKPSAYIGNGAWSIGNELVFYVFFPLFILSYKFLKPLFYAMIVMTVALIIYFSFFIFNVNSTIGEQWKTYVNPFNQIHFFFGGYIMGLLFMKRNTNKILSRILLFIGLLLFCFYPVQGDRIHLVTGMNRIVFIAVCFMITYGVYKDDYKLTGFVKRGLLFLGEASYSIYLLHQIVFFCVNGVNTKFLHFNKSLVIALSVASTFAAAYIVYTFFEKPLTEKGRVVIKKIINRP